MWRSKPVVAVHCAQSSAAAAAETWKDLHSEYAPPKAAAVSPAAAAATASSRGSAAPDLPLRVDDHGNVLEAAKLSDHLRADGSLEAGSSEVNGLEQTAKLRSAEEVGDTKELLRAELRALPDIARFVRERPLLQPAFPVTDWSLSAVDHCVLCLGTAGLRPEPRSSVAPTKRCTGEGSRAETCW